MPVQKGRFFSEVQAARACVALAVVLCACGKPAPDATKQASPASPGDGLSLSQSRKNGAETTDMELAAAATRILNAGHRNGGVILHGTCGAGSPGRASGIAEQYPLHAPVTLEPLDKALQEISLRHQNIYWRESRVSGVRVVDSTASAGLLRVRVKEFRIVEDREPDGVMAAVWRTPEVAAFLRRNHVSMVRRPGTARKAISPPMIVEMRNAAVADILDRIAAGYRADPPKVWIYRECGDKKEMLAEVEMK